MQGTDFGLTLRIEYLAQTGARYLGSHPRGKVYYKHAFSEIWRDLRTYTRIPPW
jgi:hypothetical protein